MPSLPPFNLSLGQRPWTKMEEKLMIMEALSQQWALLVQQRPNWESSRHNTLQQIKKQEEKNGE